MGTTLPPGAQALVDSLVGTFIGGNRSEVLRFIVVSWLSDHWTMVLEVGRRDEASREPAITTEPEEPIHAD
jgi:hypothetical protein